MIDRDHWIKTKDKFIDPDEIAALEIVQHRVEDGNSLVFVILRGGGILKILDLEAIWIWKRLTGEELEPYPVKSDSDE